MIPPFAVHLRISAALHCLATQLNMVYRMYTLRVDTVNLEK
jgi:hypothetical protein